MTESHKTLHERMQAAADALDFEEAKRLRDMISLIRGGATSTEAAQANGSGLVRQRPGSMGLGTSQQAMESPMGWTPPPKPKPLTLGHRTRRR